jgi:SAM-dependent methyltransferase
MTARIEDGVEDRPFPGEELVMRVAGGTDRRAFLKSGRQSVRETAAILGVVGRGFSDYERILDFGAGCGRMLMWLDDLVDSAQTSVFATDTDSEAIAWVSAHLPFVKADVNHALPPLPYLNGFFDLVYNHSVFSHIDEPFQDAWLAEIARIANPGAHIVLTVHGEYAFANIAGATGTTYVVVAADRGRRLRGQVTATVALLLPNTAATPTRPRFPEPVPPSRPHTGHPARGLADLATPARLLDPCTASVPTPDQTS